MNLWHLTVSATNRECLIDPSQVSMILEGHVHGITVICCAREQVHVAVEFEDMKKMWYEYKRDSAKDE